MATKVKTKLKESSNGAVHDGEVMTLEEAAAWLRVSEEGLRVDVESGRIPAKKIAGRWRLVRSNLIDWFGKPEPMTTKESKRRLLELAGVWKDDPSVASLMEAIEQERRRRNLSGNRD